MRGRRLANVIGLGIDVLLYYTPEGLSMFRLELECYLDETGLLDKFRRGR